MASVPHKVRVITETEFNIEEFRKRIQKVSDAQLLRFGRTARNMCDPSQTSVGDRRSANGLGHLHGGRIRLLLLYRNHRFVLSDWFRRPAHLIDFLFLWFSFLSTACVSIAHDPLLFVYHPYRECHSSHDSPLPSTR